MAKSDLRCCVFEGLEPRLVMATFTVDTVADERDGNHGAGDFSLREAVELANESEGADTIRFSSALAGKTLALLDGQLTISDDLTVRGYDDSGGAIGITLSGGGASRLFNIAGVSLKLEHLTLTGGHASLGGAIQNSGGTLAILDSTISGSSASLGGAIYSGALATTTITRSTLRGNSAVETGGAVHSNGTLTIAQSTLSDNSCDLWGGAVYAAGSLTIRQSTFLRNEADQHGGAVYVDLESTALVTNSTFSANRAGDSGGALASVAQTHIANSTIIGNVADKDADGVGKAGGVSSLLGVVRLTSTIVAANTRGSGDTASDLGVLGGDFADSSSYNLIGDASSSAGLTDGVNGNIVGKDPQLGELAANGGPTRTFAPLPGSRVINAGSNPLNLAADQRGAARVSGVAADIGAFETGGPQITGFETDLDSIAQGDAITLTASGADGSGGDLASVSFYHDADRDGIADPGELLGTDSNAADGFSLRVAGDSTVGFALGDAALLAVGTDGNGADSAPALANVGVVYSLRMPPEGAARTTSTSGDEHHVVIRNSAGDLIVFTGAGEDWQAVRLRGETGAPAATGEPVIWTDVKDGLIYVAAPSTVGFILYTRDPNGDWSFRNLSDELGAGSDSLVRALTHFTSTSASGSRVLVAGMSQTGKLAAFQQTGGSSGGGWDWEFVNISGDLASQGMQTPQFNETISYVTPWNAWTIAGIDGNGDIQGVWIAAAFDKWRVDNLSDITGAPPITGQLTVTQTSWSAINLGGVNPDGHLVVTWWIPRFKGDWVTSDLTEASGGDPLAPGRVTGFVTPWGAINYAGLNADGEVAAYWWTPQTNEWMVTALTARLPDEQPRPVGTLTSHVSETGTMSILGGAANGDLIRVWWMPGGDGFWHLTDVTTATIRA